ncbi:hypothetical protein D3C78_1219090 [compost metagenome]
MSLRKIEEMRVISLSKTYSAFGLKDDLFSQLGLAFQYVSEYGFRFACCIDVGVVKHVDSDL